MPAGGGAGAVVNVMSLPAVVPREFVATLSRKGAFGSGGAGRIREAQGAQLGV